MLALPRDGVNMRGVIEMARFNSKEGMFIRQKIEESGMSRSELSARTGLSTGFLTGVVAGAIQGLNPAIVRRIGECLGFTEAEYQEAVGDILPQQTHTLDEVLDQFGYTREQLRSMPE